VFPDSRTSSNIPASCRCHRSHLSHRAAAALPAAVLPPMTPLCQADRRCSAAAATAATALSPPPRYHRPPAAALPAAAARLPPPLPRCRGLRRRRANEAKLVSVVHLRRNCLEN